VLLFNYIIGTIKDDDVKLSILMNWLTILRVPYSARPSLPSVELKIHEEAEAGKPLTGDTFSKIYKDIVDKYYVSGSGHMQGGR